MSQDSWEYKILMFPSGRRTKTGGLPDDMNQRFDELGRKGWELVGTESIQRPSFFGHAGTTVGVVAFCKRRDRSAVGGGR